jgi:hypothetical protein
MTVQTLLVLQALLRHPSRELYGLELSEETGLLPHSSCPGPWASGGSRKK